MTHRPTITPANATPDRPLEPETHTSATTERANAWVGNGVWNVAQSANHDSQATQTWMLNATERIVERCSPAGGRVLILAASLPERKGNRGIPNDDEAARRRGRRMIPLMEIAAVGARLGRHLEVRLHDQSGSGPVDAPTGPHHDSHRVPAPRTTPRSASDPGAHPGPSVVRSRDVSDRSAVPLSDRATEAADRFDVVIVIADAPAPAAVPAITWSHLLNASGVLAFITHGYDPGRRAGHLGTVILRSAAVAGLVQIARIPLLEVPIRRGALAPELPAGFADHDRPPWPRRHADLFIFAIPGAGEVRETGACR